MNNEKLFDDLMTRFTCGISALGIIVKSDYPNIDDEYRNALWAIHDYLSTVNDALQSGPQ